jgi:hypothetical protein
MHFRCFWEKHCFWIALPTNIPTCPQQKTGAILPYMFEFTATLYWALSHILLKWGLSMYIQMLWYSMRLLWSWYKSSVYCSCVFRICFGAVLLAWNPNCEIHIQKYVDTFKWVDLAILTTLVVNLCIKLRTQPCNLHRQKLAVEWPIRKSSMTFNEALY